MALFKGSIRSEVLNMNTGLSVVLPHDSSVVDVKNPVKVLYLLHGLKGNADSWNNNTSIERYARLHGVAVVMPEVQNSFYMNMAMGPDYFTYITQELPEICSQMFSFSKERQYNYIAGLSMGGYGALKAAFTYPERYSGCASFSGSLNIEEIVKIAKKENAINAIRVLLGDDMKLKDKDKLDYLVQGIKASRPQLMPNIYITCGKQDYLFSSSNDFIGFLDKEEIPFAHEFWDGTHEWDFWDKSIEKYLNQF